VGLTFAKGLRAFLRQDPNVIMVGEIRDRETAELAVQASLTGHLVLATLHTNSAATAIPRLLDMGVEPFLLASTINLVAAQRLVRRVCTNCRKQYIASPEEINKIRETLSSLPDFDFNKILQNNGGKIILNRGSGCDVCNNTGYKGRVGIFEVLEITDKIRGLIVAKETGTNIQKVAAQDHGMYIMIQDGFIKVLEGITTIEEVLRVIG
jgi:type II secretory ATPase GspE/PulE/Tfp pilus assembly ATPase PilB-like protein